MSRDRHRKLKDKISKELHPPEQVWGCGVVETPAPPPQVPELSAVFVKARIPSLYLDSDFSMLAIAN